MARVEIKRVEIKQKLQAGEAVCVLGGHFSSDMVDFLGPSGIDGIWIECEHGAPDWQDIGDYSRAADLWGMASLVRVYQNEPGVIGRTLDRGASGVVVPHVSTREEAERAARAALYAPQGMRGMYGPRRSYGRRGDYYQQANDETLVVVMIEEAQAIANLDEILAVPGVDVFMVASQDLAQTMGHIGNATHPEVRAAIERALRTILDSGRVAGMAAGAAAGEEQRFLDMGVQFLYTTWPRFVAAGARQVRDMIQATNATRLPAGVTSGAGGNAPGATPTASERGPR